ncbi:hypothetical protein ABDC18_002869 [Escherichia coli]
MSNITQELLREKYDYNPYNDSLIYKYDANRRYDWNDRYAGKEVKPVLSADKKYVFVCDALYSMSHIISIWEGDKRNLTKKTAIDLVQDNNALIEELKSLPVDEIKSITNSMLKGETHIKDVAKKVRQESKIKRANKIKKVYKRSIDTGLNNLKVKKQVSDYFDVNDVAEKENTGLPSNIYLHPDRNIFYVKVSYKGKSHRRSGFKSLNEAFAIRNEIYNQLIEAEKQGVDLATFEVELDKKERKPPLKKTNFDSQSINPKTNLPHHVYMNKTTGRYVVLVTHKGKQHKYILHTLEEAIKKRNALYGVLNNGNNSTDTSGN